MLPDIAEASTAEQVADAVQQYMERYPLTNSWVDRKGGQSISHVYSVPEAIVAPISKLLEGLGCPYWEVTTKHMKGIYAESEEFSYFIYQPNPECCSVDVDDFNQSIDTDLSAELVAWADANNVERLKELNHETFKALLVTHMFAISHIHGIGIEDVKLLKAFNSYQGLVNNHHHLTNNTPFEEQSRQGRFALKYHVALRALAEIFKGETDLTIHDVATNTAHFPLLINTLTKDDMFGLSISRVCCSDIDVDLVTSSIADICKVGEIDHSNIEVSRLDLLDQTATIDSADIITSIDLLEHFDEQQSQQVLANLWRMTNQLLMIHVPFEDVPCEQYGHLTAFNADKLRLWAEKLEGCRNITEQYRYIMSGYKFQQIFDQYLFLLREG